jgi:hypothetical protein
MKIKLAKTPHPTWTVLLGHIFFCEVGNPLRILQERLAKLT